MKMRLYGRNFLQNYPWIALECSSIQYEYTISAQYMFTYCAFYLFFLVCVCDLSFFLSHFSQTWNITKWGTVGYAIAVSFSCSILCHALNTIHQRKRISRELIIFHCDNQLPRAAWLTQSLLYSSISISSVCTIYGNFLAETETTIHVGHFERELSISKSNLIKSG